MLCSGVVFIVGEPLGEHKRGTQAIESCKIRNTIFPILVNEQRAKAPEGKSI